MDDDGVQTEPADSELSDPEFVDAPDGEVELQSLRERAARNAERARAIAETTLDDELRDQAEKRNTLMLKFSEVAAQIGGMVQQGVANGIMEPYNIVRNRTAGEWGTQEELATMTELPQLTQLWAQRCSPRPDKSPWPWAPARSPRG